MGDVFPFFLFFQDNEIVVFGFLSGSPKDQKVSWYSHPEKILVDVLSDKLISRIVPGLIERTLHTFGLPETLAVSRNGLYFQRRNEFTAAAAETHTQ